MQKAAEFVSASAIPPCPCCGAQRYRRLFVKKGRHFWRCRECGCERIFPQPTLPELQNYYDSSYQAGMYQDFLAADEMKRLTAETRFEKIRAHCRPGRWLDVGCSSGLLVETACRAGMQAEGIELSDLAVQEGKRAGQCAGQPSKRSSPGTCSTR